MRLPTSILRGVYLLSAVIAIGTAGYMIIEHWSFLDALYMTITTITTVGYREVRTLDTAGRIFTLFLIVVGVGGAFYTLTNIMVYIVEAQFGSYWRRRRMETKIDKMKGHFVICGYGRVGQVIAYTFQQEGAPFVIIEQNAEAITQAEQAGYLALKGDATSDDVLKAAGLEHARGLVSAVGDDAINTYIVLSARQLRPDLFIEARASGRTSETKLKKAGADRTISPHSIGAHRMAMLALRPAVVDFIDTVTSPRGREFQMENIAIDESSPLVGLTVSGIRKRTKTTILAISKKSGKLLPNPPDEELIGDGDRLIVIGLKERMAAVEGAAEGA
ncbi:MAG: NAD-binding protein [Dehalococcoidales bacterium]